MRQLLPVVVIVLAVSSACSYSTARTEPASPPPATGSANEAAAATESAALISALGAELREAAGGATADATSPTTMLRKAPETYMFGDPALGRTGWWTVPLSYRAIVDYLAEHAPHGTRSQGPGTATVTGPGIVTSYDTQIYLGPSSAAYSGAEMDVFAQRMDDGRTAVRADTYISPRAARTPGSHVNDRVTSVGVALHVSDYGATSTGHFAGHFTIDDPASVDRLVGLLNGLPGEDTNLGTCAGGPGAIEDVTLTLHTANGDVTVHVHAAYTCQPLEATISRDGVQQGPVLDAKGMTAMVNTWVKKVEEASR